MQFLIDHPELRKKMGERGRTFVRARFVRERLVKDIEEIYRDLLCEKETVTAQAAPAINFSGKGNGL
jgi:hypothetical protein